MDFGRPEPGPHGPQGPVARAQASLAAGRAAEAEAILTEAAQRQPGNAQLALQLGVLLQRIGKAEGSVRELRRAARLQPHDPRVHLALGQALRLAGRGEGALGAFEHAAWLAPRHKGIRCAIAETLDHLHRREEALEAVEGALRLDPMDPFARVLAARIQRRNGKLERARSLLEGTLGGGAPGQVVIQGNFELGRVLDRMGDFDGAFAAFTRANQALAATPQARAFDPEQFFRRIEAYARLTPAELEAWGAEAPADDSIPAAFLVGFPRSGTTMTEQMLSANRRIVTTDEAPLVRDALLEVEKRAGGASIDEALRGWSDAALLAARTRYRESVRACLGKAQGGEPGEAGADRLLVDKMPLNIVEAGFMARAFPEGRMIVALRDPRDVCLSCFQQAFLPNPAMVNFFSIERAAALYEAVMGLWLRQRDALPLSVLEIRYEDTVADTAARADELCGFLDVEPDEEMLRFHEPKHRRFITTPSNEAVSEPVHGRAVGRWRNYEAHLAPILNVLEPFVDAFGYDR